MLETGNFLISRVNEVLGREKIWVKHRAARSGERVLRPAFTAVMPLAWQRGWKGQGQGQVFLGEDPPPQDTASFQSCCNALFGWKGWWVRDPLLLPLFFSSVPSSASSRPPMQKGMTLREQGWRQRAMLAGEEDVEWPPFALKPCVNIVKANPDPWRNLEVRSFPAVAAQILFFLLQRPWYLGRL